MLTDLSAELREAIDAAGGVRQWASRHQLPRTFVYDVLAGRRPASGRVLDALGLRVAIVRDESPSGGGEVG